MAQQAIVRNEFVCAEDITPDELRCPRCQSNTLVLYGNGQVSRVETLENGTLTHVRVDESSHTFEIETIECMACETRWHIKTREVTELERRNEELRQLVISTTGHDPYEMGKAN